MTVANVTVICSQTQTVAAAVASTQDSSYEVGNCTADWRDFEAVFQKKYKFHVKVIKELVLSQRFKTIQLFFAAMSLFPP